MWMIYGANGYTGGLIAAEASRRGLRPILAGRNRAAIDSLGKELKLPARIFSFDNPEEVAKGLEGVALVLHCAGPFSKTSGPMLTACLRSKSHYLDITGEIAVFESIFRRGNECKTAGIVAIPGVGFDVVPSDCLAAMLKKEMPEATSLSLAMKQSGTVSPGTLKTVIEGLDQGGMVRRDGKLVAVSSVYAVRKIRYLERMETSVTIPWGDVATAYYSTGIPNIEFYTAIHPGALGFLRIKRILHPVLSRSLVKRGLQALVESLVKGPTISERETLRTRLWGEATNAAGKSVELRLDCPESYQLTVDSALRATEAVLAGKVAAGVQTPSLAFGAEFVLSLNGVKLIE
jgi:short subunit dehydrogenase-like uncharacterized protein